VYDEYTSVVDRTVGKIMSAALAKGIKNKTIPCRFIAVTCHYDIVEWLTPDWTLDLSTGKVERRLLRRPPIELQIFKCDRSLWKSFSRHHYLNSDKLSTCSQCYAAVLDGIPVSFVSVMPNAGHFGRRRISRIVTLPDYQGIGIGKRLLNFVADLYKQQGLRTSIGTSHPAMVQSLRVDKSWVLTSIGDSHHNKGTTPKTMALRNSIRIGRKVACFEFVGCP